MKILILRFSSIGDIVLTSPVMRILKQQYPNAEIHFCTKQSFSQIVKPNPYINQVWELQKGNEKELIGQLKKQKFDYILDLHNNIRTLRFKLSLGIWKSKSVKKQNWKKWCMVHLKWKLNCTHIVHRYIETAAKFGIKYDGKGLDYFIEKTVVLSPTLEEILNTPNLLVYAVGGTYSTKRLPVQKIRDIQAITNCPILLLGDKKNAEEVKSVFPELPENIYSFCGELSLDQSALVLKKAQRVIAHDSGLMHIAAAFQKPILSLWGNTIPAFGMSAFFADSTDKSAEIIIEEPNLKCRPCSKLGYNQCPKVHFTCMQNLAEQFITKEVTDWLKLP